MAFKVDFKKILKDSGTNAILHINRPRLPATVSDRGSEQCYASVWVEFEIVKGDIPDDNRHVPTYYLKLYGGPTGYESIDLVKLLSNKVPDAVWVACMGCHIYRRMEIRIDDIRRAVADYNVNYNFEVL
jgi:hypothetical protein